MTTLSHQHFTSYDKALREIENRIGDTKNLLELLERLKGAKLGRYLIENRGINAFWTDVVVNFPLMSQAQKEILNLTDYDIEMLTHLPTLCATQERFGIFKQEIAKLLMGNNTILVAPSGLLPEIVSQDFSDKTVHITACDIDAETQTLLKKRLQATPLESYVDYCCEDIFCFDRANRYDLVVSNGLNIYIADSDRLKTLFAIFYSALRSKGVMITSFLTHPIGHPQSPWQMDKIDQNKLLEQKRIFVDILQATWSHFRSEAEMRKLLSDIGFIDIELILDRRGMFPTIKAIKP
ncbi:MAG: SAM-dependent methyltransferase [Francisellaceae bacterium]